MHEERSKPGRPRDRAADDTIRKAALKLVRERGYRNVAITTIAREAGVARQSVYNRWATKADLVLDAVFEDTGRNAEPASPTPDISCRMHLEAFLERVFDHSGSDGGTLRALIAAAQEDPDFQNAFRERFVKPREELVTRLLIEAQDRGELPRSADPDLLSAMVHGTFWYRLFNGRDLDHGLAREIAASVFR